MDNDDEQRAAQVYVTGVGWCWMRDGEIIENIHNEELGGAAVDTGFEPAWHK